MEFNNMEEENSTQTQTSNIMNYAKQTQHKTNIVLIDSLMDTPS